MPRTKQQIANKTLLIQEAVSKLEHFSRLYGIQSIFIVGGYCRELYRDKIWQVKDIDVASAYHEQAVQLGGLFASEALKTVPVFYARTGTAAVNYTSKYGTIKIEFQGAGINSYMYNQEVRGWMQRQNIDDVPLMTNIYGRDFTINSLLYSLHNGHMYDPTERAIPDFERKVIKSLLPADLLIKYNPLAALRAIRFAIRYDFRIDGDLRHAIREAGIINLRKSLSEDRIIKEIVNILKTKAAKGFDLLKNLELDRILLHPDIKEYLEIGAKEE